MKHAQSMSAISYYLPIIDGWVKPDDFVNKWSNISGKKLHAGYILSGIYLVDMAMDHHKQWGSRRIIEKTLREHPNYNLMLEFQEPDVQPYQRKKRDLLLNHPLLFKLKFNVIGAIEYLARLVLRIKPVSEWRLKRKYPLAQMPTNE